MLNKKSILRFVFWYNYEADDLCAEKHSDEEDFMKKRSVLQNTPVSPNRKAKRKFTRGDKWLLWAAILLFICALAVFAWRPVENYFREQKTATLIKGIEKGNPTIVVDRYAWAIPGEGYETIPATSANPSANPSETVIPKVDLPKDVVLTAVGTIQMDKIDLNLPLLDSALIVPLRYGAGILEGTALPGEDGNCVVLGHRMKAYGKLFNRLGEMSIGDSIVITRMDGTVYTYIVDTIIPKLDPTYLKDYIGKDAGTGKQLTLITCTPTGVGTHRLIIIAHLQE